MWVVVVDPVDIQCEPFIIGPFDDIVPASVFARNLEDSQENVIRTTVTYLTMLSFWWMKVNAIAPFPINQQE